VNSWIARLSDIANMDLFFAADSLTEDLSLISDVNTTSPKVSLKVFLVCSRNCDGRPTRDITMPA